MDLTVFEDAGADDPEDKETAAALAALETDLGLSQGFVNSLLNEDDWSFIVKAYALVEASVTQLLTTSIGQPKIADDIATLPIRKKLSIMTSLGMLDGREQACVMTLTGIRNRLAHNISHVGFDLNEYVRSLPPDELVNFAFALHPYRDDDKVVTIDGKEYPLKDLLVGVIRSLPKRAIHRSVLLFLSVVSHHKQTEALLKERNMTLAEFAERLLKSTGPSAALAGLIAAQAEREGR